MEEIQRDMNCDTVSKFIRSVWLCLQENRSGHHSWVGPNEERCY